MGKAQLVNIRALVLHDDPPWLREGFSAPAQSACRSLVFLVMSYTRCGAHGGDVADPGSVDSTLDQVKDQNVSGVTCVSLL